MILGSSIVKHVQGRKIKQKSGIYAKVCSFPGADTEKVCDHAEVELKYSKPETVIIHTAKAAMHKMNLSSMFFSNHLIHKRVPLILKM